MNRFFNTSKKGFTLTEILMVMTILAVFALIVLVNLSNGKAKARDARRKTDIKDMIGALQVYRESHGAYPATSYAGTCGTAIDGTDLLSVGLVGDKLLPSMPVVPSNSGTCGDAYYSGTWNSGQNIAVLTKLENNDPGCTPWPGPTGWNLAGSYCDGKYIQILP